MSSNREWDELYQQATSRVEQWRKEHPRATFLEIAAQVDEQLSRVRAQMVQDVAQQSEAAQAGNTLKCAECGHSLRTEGRHKRKLLSEHDQQLELARSYARCPCCGKRFFPPR